MYEEARQALEYAVKLHERAETYAALGEVARASHDYRRAAEAYEQAVALEPLNHGYLDHLVDVCILGGRNAAAAAAFEKFRAAGGAEARLQALSARLKPSPRRRTTRPTRPL
jgi:Tfp pilus assembly protein PilF